MIFLLAFSCTSSKSDSSAPPPISIIEIDSWRLGSEIGDPYPDHRPEEIICPPSAIRLELEQLEVQLGICNYAHIIFDVNQDLKAGTAVELLILHTGLWAAEAGRGHAAWSIGSDILWEEEPAIPAQAEFFFSEHTLSRDVSIGEQIHFHLHNHGANDWKVGYFNRIEQQP